MRNENKITREDIMSDNKLKQAKNILLFFYILFSIVDYVTLRIFNKNLAVLYTKIAVLAFDRAVKI